MEKVAASVESIEARAQEMLEEARKRANEILAKTREECKSIASAELPPDESQATCENVILVQAREEANRIVAESNRLAAEIRNAAKKRMKEIVNSVVMTVTGD